MAYKQEFPNLCAPLHIGKLTLRNRMCSAPMGFPDLTEDGCLTEGAIAFYELRAKGGAAVVTISEACVDYENGKSHGRLINLCNPGVLAGLTNAARAIKRHGALASIELNHAGMLSDFDVIVSERKVGENCRYGPIDTVLDDGTLVKAMDKTRITEAIDKFAKGAALVKRAGFDMLMLHAGHGWLIHQFLSKVTNKRTDEYGGSMENRARLAVEIIDAVRAAVGRDFPIEVRFSAMELAEGGVTLEDAIEFAKLIEDKVDILHVSAGGEPDFGITHPPMFAEAGCNVKYAAEIKKHVHIPVATVGALNEPSHMEEIIASGQADIVCMARALLADHELPLKVAENRSDEILRCLRCFMCHAERMLTQTRVCAINPVIGREYENRFVPAAESSKKVLVAGGGPGGMQSALTAARRGHKVILCEKTDRLGGMLRCEENVPFKKSFAKYTETMSRQLELAGVEIRPNTEVTPTMVEEIAPDVLIAAVGAGHIVPAIDGIERENVVFAADYTAEPVTAGKRVAVLGGGLAGSEFALHYAESGHIVTLIEMSDTVAAEGNPRHRPILLKRLGELAVDVRTGLKGKRIADEGIYCETADGSEILIPADTVIVAVGMQPDREKVDALRGTAPRVHIIGDCLKPGLIRDAVFRGYHAALDI
ncbi:MAG: FAD-dependent oxidoreductase [Oscillospiraceae bacterium]|nr:FAD-dependent oxidoreductase [Oscillospiraceae bacterium]